MIQQELWFSFLPEYFAKSSFRDRLMPNDVAMFSRDMTENMRNSYSKVNGESPEEQNTNDNDLKPGFKTDFNMS